MITPHKPKYRPLTMSIWNVTRAVLEDVNMLDTLSLWFLEDIKGFGLLT